MTTLSEAGAAPYTPIINLIGAPLGAGLQFVIQEGNADGTAFARLNQPQTEGSSINRTPSANDLNENTLGLLASLVGLVVINAPYAFDGTNYLRMTGGLASVNAPTLANVAGQDVRSFFYVVDADTSTDGLRVTGGLGTVDIPTLANVAGADVRAFLYGLDSGTTTRAVRLRATAGGFLRTFSENAIAGTITTIADVTTGAAASVLAANLSRIQVIVQNLDTVVTNTCRIGESTSISGTRGIRLRGLESITLTTTAEIFAVAEVGTPAISITEIEV